MPRKEHPRELGYGRVAQWKQAMSDKKTVPGYVGTLDMQDPVSVRAYVRDCLAMSVDPSVAGLKRLEMLEAHAERLEAQAKQEEAANPLNGPQVRLVDANRASEVLVERLRRRDAGE
jgi:hypothetical protein